MVQKTENKAPQMQPRALPSGPGQTMTLRFEYALEQHLPRSRWEKMARALMYQERLLPGSIQTEAELLSLLGEMDTWAIATAERRREAILRQLAPTPEERTLLHHIRRARREAWEMTERDLMHMVSTYLGLEDPTEDSRSERY